MKLQWTKRALGALSLAVVLLLSACGQGASSAASAGSAASAATAYKDTLNIAITAQPPTLDSALTVSQVALDVAKNIFEQLVTLDENYEPVPLLAETIETSEDGLTYTFKLREGILFHNGKEMTSEDVVASMNRWLATSSRAKSLLAGANFEATDKYVVTLTVQQATSDVLIIMGSRAQFPAIMPKEIVETAPAEGITEYIGTGPYKFEEWKQDQYVHLVRNEEYQSPEGEPSGYAGRRDAPTENLYFYVVSDHSTRIAGIKTGEYDVADSIPIESYDELEATDGVELYTQPGGTLTAFFNTTQGLLANPTYRQAILAALNNDEIMLASFAKPELYTLDPGYMNLNQTQWATDAGAEYYNQNDPEKAKKLLEEAGYNGETVTLLTTQDYAEMYAATLVIQEQLRQIGMNVEVVNYDFPTFLETKNDRSKWDIFVTSNGYQITPPQILAVNADWAGLDSPEVAQALVAIRGATSAEAAKQEWEKLQAFLYEYGSSSVLGHYYTVVATTSSVEGFTVFDAPIVWNAKVAE